MHSRPYFVDWALDIYCIVLLYIEKEGQRQVIGIRNEML